jgi:hypothetical protein
VRNSWEKKERKEKPDPGLKISTSRANWTDVTGGHVSQDDWAISYATTGDATQSCQSDWCDWGLCGTTSMPGHAPSRLITSVQMTWFLNESHQPNWRDWKVTDLKKNWSGSFLKFYLKKFKIQKNSSVKAGCYCSRLELPCFKCSKTMHVLISLNWASQNEGPTEETLSFQAGDGSPRTVLVIFLSGLSSSKKKGLSFLRAGPLLMGGAPTGWAVN